MIQDILPYRYSNEYKPEPPTKSDYLLFYADRKVLVRREEGLMAFPVFEEAEAFSDPEQLYREYIYLFSIDDMRFYLGEDMSGNFIADPPEGYTWEDVQVFRGAQPRYLSFAGATGWQLHRWYHSHRYCGRCGRPMERDGKERMLYCPECRNMEYPRICPAVIIAVTHGNRILLSKYAGREYKKYALLAGFTEIGETLEETVRREVMEEVGLRVKNITYYKSQPWSFSDTLLAGFFCELDGEEDITLDREELALAEWFEREEVPAVLDDVSLTNEMMVVFKTAGKLPDK